MGLGGRKGGRGGEGEEGREEEGREGKEVKRGKDVGKGEIESQSQQLCVQRLCVFPGYVSLHTKVLYT